MRAERLKSKFMDKVKAGPVNTITATTLFDMEPDLVSTDRVAELLAMSRETIFQWKCRPEKYGTPPDLFHKFGRRLYVRRDILKAWVISRCG